MRILALTGGVGGAKLAVGLAAKLPKDEVAFLVNTADDFEHYGLHISPDIDSLLYALAGINDPATGWGRVDESWDCLTTLKALDGEIWFQLGDKDLALHLMRTELLRNGHSLTHAVATIAKRLNIQHELLPMSDDPVQTIVATDRGHLAFQHYFVRDQCEPKVKGFRFKGASNAALNPKLKIPAFDAVVICPSNPYVSVDPVLSVGSLREQLIDTSIPILAVSPIVGNTAIKGPAAKMMRELGLQGSVIEIARHYQDLIGVLVVDSSDSAHAHEIESMGISVVVTNTIMTDFDSKKSLAQTCIDYLNESHLVR